MNEFVMPSLGADMESGTVVEWLVEPGSRVKAGDVVAVVETHKGAIEVEIFQDGVISELCVAEGETVPVGAVLARLDGEPDKEAPTPEPDKEAPPLAAETGRQRPRQETERQPSPPASDQTSQVAPTVVPARGDATERPAPTLPKDERVKVTPAARRRADQLGIDPETLPGTGIDGSVTLADVEARAPGTAHKPTSKAAGRKPRTGFDPQQMRQAIAAAMGRSKREIPHYYLGTTVDMGRALDWLESFNAGRTPETRLLPAVLLLKATARALREVPQLNGFWENETFRPESGIHVGWAVALRGGGLVAPAIHDADARPLPDLMEQLRDLVKRARAGGLRSSELTDPTVTVTNLGERGAQSVFGVIYPPQVALIGFGRIVARPWVAEDRVQVRPLVEVSLAADHRASDGHVGGRLLAAIDRLLQEPEEL